MYTRALFSAMAFVIAGCTSVVTTYDPATGHTTTRKVSGDWGMFTASTDFDVQNEARGAQPTAGCKTWKEYWEWRFTSVRKYAKDSERRIEYIKARRAQAGLPDYAWIY